MTEPEYGLDPKDCAVHVAFVDSGFTGAYTRPLIPGKEPELIQYLQGQPVIMLGVLFALKDRERDPSGADAVVGIKPFMVTPRSVEWMTDLRERAQIGN